MRPRNHAFYARLDIIYMIQHAMQPAHLTLVHMKRPKLANVNYQLAFLLIWITFFNKIRMPIWISLCKKNTILSHHICLIFLQLGRVRCLHRLLSRRIHSYCKLYLHRMFRRVRDLHRNSKQWVYLLHWGTALSQRRSCLCEWMPWRFCRNKRRTMRTV